MEEYATKFADFLEQAAVKIRSVTVDKVARGVRIAGLGILGATLAFAAVVFLLLSIFGALEIPLTTAGAYGVIGVLVFGSGLYFWLKRT